MLFSTHQFWIDHFEVRNVQNICFRQINTVGEISKINCRSIYQLVIVQSIDLLIDGLIRKQLQEQKGNGSTLH